MDEPTVTAEIGEWVIGDICRWEIWSNGRHIADAKGESAPEWAARAHQIVRDHNAHDGLVAHLNWAYDELTNIYEGLSLLAEEIPPRYRVIGTILAEALAQGEKGGGKIEVIGNVHDSELLEREE